jgi:spermidine synthase
MYNYKLRTTNYELTVGRIYFLEAIGFIFGGPTITFVLIPYLNSLQISLIISILNIISAFLLIKYLIQKSIFKKIAISIMSLLFLFSLWLSWSGKINQIHLWSVRLQFKGWQVLDYRNSIYGNIAVTKRQDQLTFFSDGIPTITTPIPDIVFVEDFVHFTLSLHEKPEDILVISGGAGGVLKEILKYPVKKTDYAELDPLIIKTLRDFPTELTVDELNDRRLNIQNLDGRLFVKKTKLKYDVVMLNLTYPSTLQINRLYTKEFFREVNNILKGEGILVLHLPGSLSYLSKELKDLNGCILETLREVFPFVYVIPGDSNLLYGSKVEISLNPEIIKDNLKAKDIKTLLFTDFYIDYRLDKRWQDWFYSSLGDNYKINFDLEPRGLFYGLKFWNAQFSPELRNIFNLTEKMNLGICILVLSILILILFLFTFKINPINLSIPFAIFSTGFFGMSLSLILILCFQITFGFIYSKIGLLVATFMTGLSFGSILMTKSLLRIKKDISIFRYIEFFIILFTFSLLSILNLIIKMVHSEFLFYILSMISGSLVGFEFPLANKIYLGRKKKTATGFLYATDLLGGCLGAFLISIVFVPVLGIINTLIFLSLLKIGSFTLLAKSR